MQRHWTINGRFLTQPLTGVQRYAWEIVCALDAEISAGGLAADSLALDLAVPGGVRLPSGLKAIRVKQCGRLRGHLWEQLVLPFLVKGGLLSLGNAGPVAIRRQIVCVHDLNSYAFPQSYSRAFRAMQRLLLPVLGWRCARIATVSCFSANEIARRGLCEARKLVIMPNGHEHVHRWTTAETTEASPRTDRDTIVMIGTPAPHKNMDMILGLADRLREAGLKIAIVGGTDFKVYQSAKRSAACNVTWLGRVPDGLLPDLLASSLCLAFPSHVEGFGLPPLEAMALGCPVVASNRASLPEICGDAALYASPLDPDGWMDCFLKLRRSEALRSQLIARGHERARLFSWRQSAGLYLAAMTEVDRAESGAVSLEPALFGDSATSARSPRLAAEPGRHA